METKQEKPELTPDDAARLTWLIRTGSYGLIDHDTYTDMEDLQTTVRQRIDEYMQAHTAAMRAPAMNHRTN
jgi:hypothetical protein